MVAAGHQEWERGDLLALTFDAPHAEAMWIADRIEHIRGIAFRSGPDAPARGLSWSDCAVLFRSVAKDSAPLVAELRARGIPFLVKGLNQLFESPEIQAVVGLFRFMVSELTAAQLLVLWKGADLIPTASDWPKALGVLDRVRDFDKSKSRAVFNIQRLYLDFLEALGIPA